VPVEDLPRGWEPRRRSPEPPPATGGLPKARTRPEQLNGYSGGVLPPVGVECQRRTVSGETPDASHSLTWAFANL